VDYNKLFLISAFTLVILSGFSPNAYAQTVDVRAIDTQSGQIIRVDPTNGNILGGFGVPGGLVASDIAGLTFAEGGTTLLYQSDVPANPSNLFRLNPTNGAILTTENMPSIGGARGGLSFETGAGVGPSDAIFAIDNGAGTDRQDGYSGAVSQHVSAATAAPIFPGALGGDDAGRHFLWANGPNGFRIYEFDPLNTNALLSNIPQPPGIGLMTGLAYDGINLYVADSIGQIFTLNPNTGVVLNQVQVQGVTLIGLAARQTGETPEGTLVGGEYFTLDTAALLLAGIQTNALWIIPALMGAAGIGIVLVRKKN